MVICLELRAILRMAQLMPLPFSVSCYSKIRIGFTFLVPAHPGSPGKKGPLNGCVFLVPAHLGSPGKGAVKRVCDCVLSLWIRLNELCLQLTMWHCSPWLRTVEHHAIAVLLSVDISCPLGPQQQTRRNVM